MGMSDEQRRYLYGRQREEAALRDAAADRAIRAIDGKINDLRTDLDRCERILGDIVRLHAPGDETVVSALGDYTVACVECGHPHPCPTVVLADG